jgi:hypothetical protein
MRRQVAPPSVTGICSQCKRTERAEQTPRWNIPTLADRLLSAIQYRHRTAKIVNKGPATQRVNHLRVRIDIAPNAVVLATVNGPERIERSQAMEGAPGMLGPAETVHPPRRALPSWRQIAGAYSDNYGGSPDSPCVCPP